MEFLHVISLVPSRGVCMGYYLCQNDCILYMTIQYTRVYSACTSVYIHSYVHYNMHICMYVTIYRIPYIAGNFRGGKYSLCSWASWPPRNFNVGMAYRNVGMQCMQATRLNEIFTESHETTVSRVEHIFYPTKLTRYSVCNMHACITLRPRLK